MFHTEITIHISHICVGEYLCNKLVVAQIFKINPELIFNLFLLNPPPTPRP